MSFVRRPAPPPSPGDDSTEIGLTSIPRVRCEPRHDSATRTAPGKPDASRVMTTTRPRHRGQLRARSPSLSIDATADLVVAWNYNEDNSESGSSAVAFVDRKTSAVVATR